MANEGTWLSYVTGQAGAVVVLLLVVLSIVRWRYLVPGYAYEQVLVRISDLEKEREEQNKSFIELTVQNAEFKSEVGSLRRELSKLNKEVERLRTKAE